MIIGRLRRVNVFLVDLITVVKPAKHSLDDHVPEGGPLSSPQVKVIRNLVISLQLSLSVEQVVHIYFFLFAFYYKFINQSTFN